MARTSTKGWLPRHRCRVFRNYVQVYLRDETFAYIQEHRKRMGMGYSHFLDYAVNELMKRPPAQIDKKEYLETFFVDHGKKTRNKV